MMPALPTGYGDACTKTSDANACGETAITTGTIACDGSCNAPEPVMPIAIDSDEDGVADCNDICVDDSHTTST